jgi:hypothetical protein
VSPMRSAPCCQMGNRDDSSFPEVGSPTLISFKPFGRRFVVGLFPYWIGLSRRDIGCARVIDAGYIKLWWWK